MADTPTPDQPKRRRTTKAAAKPADKPAAAKPRKSEAAPAADAPKPKPPRKPRSAAKPAATKAASSKTAPSAKPPARRAQRKPAAPKPAAKPSVEAAVTAPVERAVAAMAKVVPEVQPRVGLFAALGTLAAVGGAFFVWRASRAEEPAFQTIESDGPIEIRKYPTLVTAATEARGERQAALTEGFRTLADYIFAKSRAGEKLPMTAPVLSDSDGDGSWRTRFVMPAGKARGNLPNPPLGVELISEPARRVAAMRFSGRVDDATLDMKEGALRSWLQIRGLPSEGKAVHAFYNAPFVPGPFRRNEVMIALSDEGGTGA